MLFYLFGPSTVYLSWNDSDLFVYKAKSYLQVFLYDAFNGTAVEAIDCSASIPRKIATPVGCVSTRCDLPYALLACI